MTNDSTGEEPTVKGIDDDFAISILEYCCTDCGPLVFESSLLNARHAVALAQRVHESPRQCSQAGIYKRLMSFAADPVTNGDNLILNGCVLKEPRDPRLSQHRTVPKQMQRGLRRAATQCLEVGFHPGSILLRCAPITAWPEHIVMPDATVWSCRSGVFHTPRLASLGENLTTATTVCAVKTDALSHIHWSRFSIEQKCFASSREIFHAWESLETEDLAMIFSMLKCPFSCCLGHCNVQKPLENDVWTTKLKAPMTQKPLPRKSSQSRPRANPKGYPSLISLPGKLAPVCVISLLHSTSHLLLD